LLGQTPHMPRRLCRKAHGLANDFVSGAHGTIIHQNGDARSTSGGIASRTIVAQTCCLDSAAFCCQLWPNRPDVSGRYLLNCSRVAHCVAGVVAASRVGGRVDGVRGERGPCGSAKAGINCESSEEE
jgi:hypothetical protein